MLSFTTISKLINDYELYNKSVYNDPLVRPMIDTVINKILRDVHQVNGSNIDQVLNVDLNLSDQVKKIIIDKVINRFQLESYSQTMLPLQIVSKYRILNVDMDESHFLVAYSNNTVQVWNIETLIVEHCLDHDLLDNLTFAKFDGEYIVTCTTDRCIVKWDLVNNERVFSSIDKVVIKKELLGNNFRVITHGNKLTIYKFDYRIGLIRISLVNSQHDGQKLLELSNSNVLMNCENCELIEFIKGVRVF